MTVPDTAVLSEFRDHVRAWCAEAVPTDWRDATLEQSDADFVAFQSDWFRRLDDAGFAVPHWPAEWGGGLDPAKQVILFQELAAHDAPRLVLNFIAIHHAASTLLVAGTDEQRRRHLPAIRQGEIWAQAFSEPEAGSDLAGLRTRAERVGDTYVVNGQKIWASGAAHADWALLLARTDPAAPKRRGISYLLLDLRSPGIEVRPTRQSTGDNHFCEVFLTDVEIPVANLVGDENDGWRVANATLSAERGLTMLELAERLGTNGFAWLVAECSRPAADGSVPLDSDRVRDRLAGFETDLTALRAMCRNLVAGSDHGSVQPVDASIVKLVYSELLQDLTGFAAEVAGPAAHRVVTRPRSSGWESSAWVLDHISSWEWTIPGGASEIQRNIIAERGLGMAREPQVEAPR